MNKQIKGLLFFLNVFFIFCKEYVMYLINRDFTLFIERLAIGLSSINILCVKIFQAIALNNSLIDESTNNKLLQFTDNAPWNYSDVELHNLHEISKKYNLQLKFGYEVPINSGMISLVFKAFKKDELNQPVIIKMKRKNIQEKLDDAIENLLFGIKLLSFIPIFNKYDLSNVVNKNVDIIRSQTNFLEEVDNMTRIKNNSKN